MVMVGSESLGLPKGEVGLRLRLRAEAGLRRRESL